MPTLITDPNQIVYAFPFATVETKNSLDDANWSPQLHVFVDKLTLAVNAYDEAELAWEVGDVFHPSAGTFVEYVPLSLLGKFVRVTIPQEAPLADVVWVGYVVGTAQRRQAVEGGAVANNLTGDTQVLRAVGLEYFLDRVQIDSAVIYHASVPVRIFRPLPFNGGKGVTLDYDTSQRGNRAPSLGVNGVYEFVASGATGELWTTEQIIHYLLQYHGPVDSADDSAPTTYSLDPQDVLDGVLDGISPTIDAEGLTVFQALNKLLSPQRGFVWWAEFDEPFPGSHNLRIRVETLSGAAITLPSLGTVPANRDQQTLDFDRQTDVDDVITAEVGSRIYHQIITRGARMTCTGTLGFGDSTLDDDWTSAIETEYDTADSGTADKNDAFRRRERFYRVYTAFRIPANWDGKTGDGDAAARNWTIPELSTTGSVVGGLGISIEGLRILNTTRLKRGWDYEDVTSIGETTPAGTEAEYMPPFGILQVESSTDKFQFADKMGETAFGDGTPVASNISTSYHIYVQQNVPGVVLRPTNGINHALALNHWGADESNHEPEVDYETLRVTVTMEADAYAEAKYPADADLPADTPLQKLILYVGDEYRVDFLAANTIVDLDDGVPVLTNGGVLRDDRKQLQDIARVAYEWYRIERYPLTVNFRQLGNYFRLGMLITTIGEGTTQQNINTVVSMITYDCRNGVLSVKTNDQDLDLGRLA